MPRRTEQPPQVVLRVKDMAASTSFYHDLPGFSIAEKGSDLCIVIGPGNVPLLLAADGADLTPWADRPQAALGAWVYLHSPGLPALAVTLTAQGRACQGPIEPYPGYRHLLLPDPDGYLLTFWESLPVADEETLALYQSGPARLADSLKGLTEADLDLPRAPGKWTIRQIVHHIVDSDLATFQVIRLALALPGSTVNTNIWEPDDWMNGLDCARRSVAPALALYGAARAWVMEAIDHLPDGLERSVSWPSGYQAKVRDLLRQTGGHSQHHLLQIEETKRQHGH